MRKLKIIVKNLESAQTSLPYVSELGMVKLTFAEAMTLNETLSLEQLVTKYGQDRLLKEGEFYDGYLAVPYRMYMKIIKMRGCVHRIPEDEADNAGYCFMTKAIRDGKAWCVIDPDGPLREGKFVKVRTFADCSFLETIVKLRAGTDDLQDVNPKALNKSIQDKLMATVLSENKIVELTDDEDKVVHFYFMENYRHYFRRVL